MLKVLDLFSGIGGFSLGLERGGFRTVAFCEIDPFCRRVLEKHWPGVPCYHDIRDVNSDRLRADGIAVDVVCGGFPCQDISLVGGKGKGIDGERSGLWREFARIIGELRPDFVIIENSPALRTRGGDRVLSDMEEIGYSCEPVVVGAIHVGAHHRRQRAWLIAHPNSSKLRIQPGRGGGENWPETNVAAIDGIEGLMARRGERPWASEPDVGRVAHGISDRVDRLRALGNAVVPQIPEMIGRAILSVAA